MTFSEHRLPVPGATLAYKLRGSGPIVFMIPGGAGAGSGFDGIADLLADEYTIVTYDRRGFGASSIDNRDEIVVVETHSEDAHRLLAALTPEPAIVFASSAGALIAFDLLLHHPEQFKRLIAHEPATTGISQELDVAQANFMDIYHRDGALAAMKQIMADTGTTTSSLEIGADFSPARLQTLAANADSMFRYTVPGVNAYKMDIPALMASPVPITLLAGEGNDTPVYRSVTLLAQRMGKDLISFPGQHTGYISHPQPFAAKLREVLKAET